MSGTGGEVIHVRSLCRIRAYPGDPWRAMQCFVSYDNAAEHRPLVEESFSKDLGLNLEDIRRERPDLFAEPHNVARALAMHHCFRPYAWNVRYERWELIEGEALPARTPNAKGSGFSVWIESVQAD